MKNNIIFCVVILGLIFTLGCVSQRQEEGVVRINQFVMSADEFKQEFKNSPYSMRAEGREEFLQDLIDRKLILQEAGRIGLDKKQDFLRDIERFWEKVLLKNVISRKSRELAAKISVSEDEVHARYDQMISKQLIDGPFEGIHDQIKWQLLREKQTQAFDDWLEGLRREARVEVDKAFIKEESGG